MLPVGRMNTMVTIQNNVETVDSMGAPTRSWVDYLTLYAAIENEEFNSADENVAPMEKTVRSKTYIVRNSSTNNINPRQRLVEVSSGSIYEITAIRYDQKLTTCYIDCRTGVGNG